MAAAHGGGGARHTQRLVSTATYTRPHRQAPLGGVPLNTTYGATVGAITPSDAASRCVASRREQQRVHMVVDTARAIPAAAVATPEEWVALTSTAGHAAGSAAETLKLAASRRAGGANEADGSAPAAVAALAASASMQALAATLQRETRQGIRGALVQELFSNGSLDGPFPGSKSANGLLNAEQFYSGTCVEPDGASRKPRVAGC